jgi:hypothetical protein
MLSLHLRLGLAAGLLAVTAVADAIEPDKSLHAQVGFVTGAATQALTAKAQTPAGRYYGTAVGCSAGLAKELYDAAGYGKPEALDFLFTCVAAAIGSLASEKAVVYPGDHGAVFIGWRLNF